MIIRSIVAFIGIHLLMVGNIFCQTKIVNHSDYLTAIDIEDSITGPINVFNGYGKQREFFILDDVKEENSIWFRFKINQDTILTFDIVPVDGLADYDFILFKAYSTTTIDSIINKKKMPDRVCYSQNRTKYSSTGLSQYTASKIVNAGPGVAYVSSVNVKAGEIYYLMVDYSEFYLRKDPNNPPKGFRIYFYNYWPNKKPVVLQNVQFENGKAILLQSSFPELDKLYSILKQNTLTAIEIIGYTDNVGNKKSNLVLSQNRANAIADYLITKGISKDRLVTKGLGDANPLDSNKTEEGRQKNRRVEFAIIMK